MLDAFFEIMGCVIIGAFGVAIIACVIAIIVLMIQWIKDC